MIHLFTLTAIVLPRAPSPSWTKTAAHTGAAYTASKGVADFAQEPGGIVDAINQAIVERQ